MDIIAVLLLALGLSMDAFAVSVAGGLGLRRKRLKVAVELAVLFGGFHVLMTLLGWLLGTGLKDFITGFDHWIAFWLLAFVGGKMILESFKKGKKIEKFTLPFLLLLAVATSIDALAIGLSFAFLQIEILLSVVVIGLMVGVFSFGGVFLGAKAGKLFGKRVELLGGLILIGIGVKILLEHLS